jgi:hypothetical protein
VCPNQHCARATWTLGLTVVEGVPVYFKKPFKIFGFSAALSLSKVTSEFHFKQNIGLAI